MPARDGRGGGLSLGRAHRRRLLLQVLIENREDFALPENIDQAGFRDAAFDFHNHFGRDLNQRTGGIAQTAAGMLGQLDCLQGFGNLVANGQSRVPTSSLTPQGTSLQNSMPAKAGSGLLGPFIFPHAMSVWWIPILLTFG